MNATFKNFDISISLLKRKDNIDHEVKKHYQVAVRNTENDKQTGFEYWTDDTGYEVSTEYDILNVFYDILLEVLDGGKPFKTFCKKYQFSHHNKFAVEEWKECKNSYKKFRNIYNKNIGILEKELHEIIDVDYIPDEN